MKHRWLVIVGALVIQTSLGAVYIWSVFETPLRAAFPEWTSTHVTLPAQLVLAAFATGVIIAGRIQDRLGPRPVAATGGILLCAGLALASLTTRFPTWQALAWLVVTFSLLGGLGIGVAYVCPISASVKWFPDKRGLVTGLAVAGFGAGGFFFAPLAKGLITGAPYSLLGQALFPLPALGLERTFLALGIVFFLCVTAGAQLLRNPPPDFTPPKTGPKSVAAPGNALVNFETREMIRTPSFWLLWLTFFIGCAGGLMIIMKTSSIWQSFAMRRVEAPVPWLVFRDIQSQGALAVSILSIFNAAGRIIWGKISDWAGRRPTLVTVFALMALSLLILDYMREHSLYVVTVGTIGLCFGGFLALYPAITADFFGTKNMGSNYGCMFAAFGAGGLVGPWLSAYMKRVEGVVSYVGPTGPDAVESFVLSDYRLAFWTIAAASALAAVLIALARPPEKATNGHAAGT